MNWQGFFNDYRAKFGAIKKPETVTSVTEIVNARERYGFTLPQLAYLLATAYHETAHDFIPKREYGSAAYFIRKYWENVRQRAWLGNDSADEAVKYCGRGLVQITGEVNYEKFGIADNPDKALELPTAIDIIYRGMRDGTFTGRKISHYINADKTDYYNARRVINGIDKAPLIEGYALAFEKMLKANA